MQIILGDQFQRRVVDGVITLDADFEMMVLRWGRELGQASPGDLSELIHALLTPQTNTHTFIVETMTTIGTRSNRYNGDGWVVRTNPHNGRDDRLLVWGGSDVDKCYKHMLGPTATERHLRMGCA